MSNKVVFTPRRGLTFELEMGPSDQRVLFETLAGVQEVFAEPCCGKCKNEVLRFVVRENDGNKYYELHCTKCGAKLQYGCHKQGPTLFPKRKDGDKYLPDNGWVKWDSQKGELV